MATPNRVPLGQAGTGEAFVLDQSQAMAPLRTFAALDSMNRQRAAVKAKAQADQEAEAKSRFDKIMANAPKEFSFQYQKEMQEDVRGWSTKWIGELARNGGKISPEMEYQMELERKDIELKKSAQDTAVNHISEIQKTMYSNPKYDKEAVKNEISQVYMGGDGRTRSALDITPDLIQERFSNNHKLLNKGVVVDDFVKSVNKGYFEKFSAGGKFDVETIIKHNLPIEIDQRSGQIKRDAKGNPILKVSDALVYQVESNPEMKLLLDGLEREEDEKEKTTQGYIGKTRPQILKEMLQPEIEVERSQNFRRTPAPPKPAKDPSRKYEEDVDKRYAFIRRMVEGDATAAASLVGTDMNGQKVVSARVVKAGEPIRVKPGEPGYDPKMEMANFLGGPNAKSDKNRVIVTVQAGTKEVVQNKLDPESGDYEKQWVKVPNYETKILDADSDETYILANTMLDSKEGEAKIRTEDIAERRKRDAQFKQQAQPAAPQRGKYDKY